MSLLQKALLTLDLRQNQLPVLPNLQLPSYPFVEIFFRLSLLQNSAKGGILMC